MKADRLISTLMLLQIHKQLTANNLAQRLEVSVRTIYRDIESLSSLGIPIFTDRGSNGGIKLLGDYKTTLSGLNTNELYSLFALTSDKILEDLGIEKVHENTLLKLLGDTSQSQIDEIKNFQNYIYIDMNTWSETHIKINKDILSSLQSSIWNHTISKIIYKKPNEIKEVILKPLGLVCKRGIWYLIGENNDIIKTYKVSNIKDVSWTNKSFNRPNNFNLEEYWKLSTDKFKSTIPKHIFTFKVNDSIIDNIKERQFINVINTVVKNNKIYLDISFDAMFQGVEFAFGYGKDIEIIHPVEAIDELKKKSLEIINLYRNN